MNKHLILLTSSLRRVLARKKTNFSIISLGFVVVFLFFATFGMSQTVILSAPGGYYHNTDSLTEDIYSVPVSSCGSVYFSVDFSFSVPWAGPGNMESNDECPFGTTPCPGNPATPDIGACAGCWDFFYVQYMFDGVLAYSDIVGVAGNLQQTGTISFGPICTNGASEAEIIIQTQTWASNESVTFSNVEVTCWDGSATPSLDPDPVCENDVLNLNANVTTPGDVFNTTWSGPGTIADPTAASTTATGFPLGTNTYTLVTTDANSCTKEYASTVTAIAGPTAVLSLSGNNPICSGDATSLEVNFTGTGPFTFDYAADGVPQGSITTSDNPYTININPVATTTYTLLNVSDGTCDGTVSGDVTISMLPPPTATLSLSGNNLICAGETSSFDVSFTGTGPFTFDYAADGVPQGSITTSDNPYVIHVTPGATTTYSLVSVNTGNCVGTVSGTETITVSEPPTMVLTGGGIVCVGSCIDSVFTLTTTGGTPPYTATLVLANLGSLPLPNLNNEESITICVVGSGLPSYDDISHVLTLPTYLAGAGGSLTLTGVTDANGCSGNGSGSATLSVQEPPSANNPNIVICSDDALHVDLTPYNSIVNSTVGVTVSWYYGDPDNGGILMDPPTDVDLTTVGADLYAVADNGGCSDYTFVNVSITPSPTVTPISIAACANAAQSYDLTQHNMDVSSGSGTVQWFNGDPNNGGTVISLVTAVDLTSVAGNLWVQVANGSCVAGVAIPISITQGPPANAITITSCANQSTMYDLTAHDSDVNATETVSWYLGDPDNGGTLINPATNVDLSTVQGSLWAQVSDGSTCVTNVPVNIQLNPNPTVAIPDQSFCESENPFNLTNIEPPTQLGGVWSLNNIPVVNPNSENIANLATYNYEWTGVNGCADDVDVTFTINPTPVVNAGSYAASYCTSDDPVVLSGSPAGGTFSMGSTQITQFDPSSVLPGSYLITYTFVDDVTGCIGTDVAQIVVEDCGCQLSFNVSAGNAISICESELPVNLMGSITGDVTTGVWSGGLGSFEDVNNLTTNYTPDPSEIGTTVTLTLTSVDPDGAGPCLAQTGTVDVTIHANPVVDAGTYANSYCTTDVAFPLVGTPAGGIFYLDGTPVTQFDPSSQMTGTYMVTYYYSDVNGCFGQDSVQIVVQDCGCQLNYSVDAGAPITICASDLPVSLSGSVTGDVTTGIWSGGLGTFANPTNLSTTYTPDPSEIGTTVQLTLTSDDPDGAGPCTPASGTLAVTIHELPAVDAGNYNNPYCTTDAAFPLVGSPSGGTFSYNGSDVTEFNPLLVPVGTHVVTYEYTDANGCTATDTAQIVVENCDCQLTYTVDAGMPISTCENNLQVSLNGSITGAVTTGTWSGGVGTFDNPTDLLTTYTVDPSEVGTDVVLTLTSDDPDGAGSCLPKTSTVTITVFSNPNVDAGNYPASCATDGAFLLVGNPSGGTFSLGGSPLTQFDPVAEGEGQYIVTYDYTDGNGCTGQDTALIVVNNCGCGLTYTVDAGTPQDICAGDGSVQLNGQITGVVTSGTWSGGLGSFDDVTDLLATYTPDASEIGTTVSLTLTSADPDGTGPCLPKKSTVEITIHANPTVDAGSYPASCATDGAFLLVGNPSGGTFSLGGSPLTQFDPAAEGEGQYIVTYDYTDGNGCSGQDTALIVVNNCGCGLTYTVDAGIPSKICVEQLPIHLAGNILGDVTTGSWSGGAGNFSDKNDLNATYMPTSSEIEAGQVQLTLISSDPDGNGPCVAKSSDVIIQLNQVEVELASLGDYGGYDVPCAGDSSGAVQAFVSGGTAPFDYTWNVGVNKAIHSDLVAGEYRVTVTDAEGCTDASTIQLTEPDGLAADMTAVDEGCDGAQGALIISRVSGGVPPYKAYVDNGLFAQLSDNSNAYTGFLNIGHHQLVLKDANGCDETSSFDIHKKESFSVDLGPDIFIKQGDEVTIEMDAGNTIVDEIVWFVDTLIDCNSCPEITISPLFTVRVRADVTDDKGCVGTDEKIVFVEQPPIVFVPSAFSPNGDNVNDLLEIYPNKVVEKINVFVLFDRWGNEYLRYADLPANGTPMIHWNGYFRGQEAAEQVFVYYLEVSLKDGTVETRTGDITLIR